MMLISWINEYACLVALFGVCEENIIAKLFFICFIFCFSSQNYMYYENAYSIQNVWYFENIMLGMFFFNTIVCHYQYLQ